MLHVEDAQQACTSNSLKFETVREGLMRAPQPPRKILLAGRTHTADFSYRNYQTPKAKLSLYFVLNKQRACVAIREMRGNAQQHVAVVNAGGPCTSKENSSIQNQRHH